MNQDFQNKICVIYLTKDKTKSKNNIIYMKVFLYLGNFS